MSKLEKVSKALDDCSGRMDSLVKRMDALEPPESESNDQRKKRERKEFQVYEDRRRNFARHQGVSEDLLYRGRVARKAKLEKPTMDALEPPEGWPRKKTVYKPPEPEPDDQRKKRELGEAKMYEDRRRNFARHQGVSEDLLYRGRAAKTGPTTVNRR